MLAFMFILGRTWCQWNGWPSGKLSERHAVMGKVNLVFITLKIELAVFRKRHHSFRVLFLSETLIHQFYKQEVAKNVTKLNVMDQLIVIQEGYLFHETTAPRLNNKLKCYKGFVSTVLLQVYVHFYFIINDRRNCALS